MTANLPPAIEFFLSRGYELIIWKEGDDYKFKLHGEAEAEGDAAFDLLRMTNQATRELQCAEFSVNNKVIQLTDEKPKELTYERPNP